MNETLSRLVRLIEPFCPSEGLNATPLPGVYCVKHSKTQRPSRQRWRSCFGVIIQGSKEITLGRRKHRLTPLTYTLTPIPLPILSRIATASAEQPFLALLVDLECSILTEITTQIEPEPLPEEASATTALFSGTSNAAMLDSAYRLAALLQSPEDAPVLAPLMIKEWLYHLLKSPEGRTLRDFVRAGSKMYRVTRAIHLLNDSLDRELDVQALAKSVGMSRSAFFTHFKEATALSPIQFKKRLRLIEAQRLMAQEGFTGERAAYQVGYKSASQFNREYARMFGNPPRRDLKRVRGSELSRA